MGSSLSSEQPEEEVNNQTYSASPRMSLESQSLQPKKLRKPRVTILNEILKERAKLNDDEIRQNNEILHDFLRGFISEMKKHDKTFEAIYSRIYFTGSFYSDLRVSKPDEFDLNLVLKLPSKFASVTYNAQVPSYARYSITDEKVNSMENGLKKLFENGYLIPNKVRIWIQSVVDKALKTYKPCGNVVQVRSSASGPARTILLIKRGGGQIDIDLVPAIECSLGLMPPGIDKRVYNKVQNHLQCFLIPKPYQPTKQCPVNDLERSRLWRTHYPDAESKILHDMGCVKPVIKLLKLLRDKENWKILASYYLKTILLWTVLENSSESYWKMDQIGERFVEALRTLAECVKQRKIRYFFSSRYNLLEKLTDAQATNIYNRLIYIIKEIERNDNKLWEIFGCRPTFTM